MKDKKIVLIVSIIGFLLVISGLTFAYIRKTTIQTNNNEINTLTCLAFEMTNKEGSITLTNAYPIPDAEGLEGTPYSFTITNKCNTPIVVDIGMQTIGTGLNKNYIKYAIDDGTNEPGIFTIGSKPTKTVKVDTTNVTINVLDKVFLDANTAEDQDTSTVEVDNDTPSEGASKTYNVRLWIDEATTWEQAHDTNNNILNYTGKIVLAASPTKGRYTPEFTAETGTLLAAIKTGDYEFLNPLTSPGKEINSYSESLIATTQDDYGTSYYFRGNVQNNYVIFANKCWKILRIDGQENIKLFYWGNVVDGTCTNNSHYISNVFNNKRVEGQTNPEADYFKRTDAYTYNRPAGVGFMYGEPMAETYQGIDSETRKPNGAQDNIYDSDILIKLKEFYNTNIINVGLENYLADVIWCGDKSLDKVNATGNGWEFGTNTFFGARARVYANGVANAKPSLVCPEAGTDGKLSKYTAADTTNGNGMLKGTNGVGDTLYKIGLITADEAAFAGGAYGIANNSYYLWTNSYYWTMSPSYFDASSHLSYLWSVFTTGILNNGYVSYGRGVRPAVSLKSTATIEQGGDGTVNNPYVINGLAS